MYLLGNVQLFRGRNRGQGLSLGLKPEDLVSQRIWCQEDLVSGLFGLLPK